jgi:hypothetical protein
MYSKAIYLMTVSGLSLSQSTWDLSYLSYLAFIVPQHHC